MWDGQVAALKDRYQVIVWDMRGHGESDYPSDPALYSEALTVGDMACPARRGGRREGDRRRPVAGRLHVARLQRQPSRPACAR